MRIINLPIVLVTFILSFHLFAQEPDSGIEVKLISGKILLYREGVHMQFDGNKMLRPGDVLQTMGDSNISIAYRNFQVTLSPYTFFQLQGQQTKKHIMIGKLLFGSIHTSLQVVRTDKPYQVFGHHFTATMSRHSASMTTARNRRELMSMTKGEVSGAPEILNDIKEIENTANLSTQVTVLEGPVTVSLQEKKEKMLNSNQALEFRAEGLGDKISDIPAADIKAMYKSMKFNLPFL